MCADGNDKKSVPDCSKVEQLRKRSQHSTPIILTKLQERDSSVRGLVYNSMMKEKVVLIFNI